MGGSFGGEIVDLTPQTRIEFFINDILGGSDNLTPVYRAEKYLAQIAGRVVSLPEAPQTRMEAYLAKIAGEDVEIPAAPQTRLETFLASIAGETVELPTPICRLEEFLLNWIENAHSEVELTVTGVSPVTLANAVAKPLTELTVYGKCTQSGTPSAASPVDIYCNDGKIYSMDDNLPDGYKRLKGFTFANNCYFTIPYYLKGSDTVRFKFKPTAACNVFGSYTSASSQKNYSLYLTSTQSGKYMRYNGGTYASGFTSSELGEVYDVEITPWGSSGLPRNDSWEEVDFEADTQTYLGTTSPSSTSSKFVGDMIGAFEIENEFYLIPAERESDNALGYFNAWAEDEEEAFILPTVGTPVSLGYDNVTGHSIVIENYGNSYLTLNGQRISNYGLTTLLSTGDISDEVDVIAGVITKRCEVTIYDSTQSVGTSYISSTGGLDDGAVVVYALPSARTRSTGQYTATAQDGTNTVAIVNSSVGAHNLKVVYTGESE